jgi:hypothetical protein
MRSPVDPDRADEIAATFERIQRPLRWPLEDYGRRTVKRAGFTGYVFTRSRGTMVAGFAHGFALRAGAFPGIASPPEAVTYVFIRPLGSALYRDLVTRPRSPVRRLVAESRTLANAFEFHPGDEVVATRHRSFARVPPELFVLSASDFFMLSQQPLLTGGFVRRVTAATERRGT